MNDQALLIRRRRLRNYCLGGILLALVGLFFAITLVRMGN